MQTLKMGWEKKKDLPLWSQPGAKFEENIWSSVFLNWKASFPPFYCPLKKEREREKGEGLLRRKTLSPLCWAVHNWRLVFWISQNHPICFIKTIKAVFPAQCVSSPIFLKKVNLNSGGKKQAQVTFGKLCNLLWVGHWRAFSKYYRQICGDVLDSQWDYKRPELIRMYKKKEEEKPNKNQ